MLAAAAIDSPPERKVLLKAEENVLTVFFVFQSLGYLLSFSGGKGTKLFI